MVPADKLEALCEWASRNGLALFPIRPFCKDPKWIYHPDGRPIRHSVDASKEPSQWRAWYGRYGGCNFGIEMGASDCIAVDVDEREDGTPAYDAFWGAWINADARQTVTTPSGGRHHLMRSGDPSATGCASWARGEIDVRAGAAFVLAPWCVTDPAFGDPSCTAGRYDLVADVALPQAPLELLDHCRRRVRDAALETVLPYVELSPDGLPADLPHRQQMEYLLDGWCGKVRLSVPGERNIDLNEAAFVLGRYVWSGYVGQALVEARLSEAGAMVGLTSHEIRATIRSGLKGAKKADVVRLNPTISALLASPKPTAGAFPECAVRPLDAVLPFVGRSVVPVQPVVERLLIPGNIAVLVGASGSGKTTVVASLMAASVSGLRHFNTGFGCRSDIMMRECCFIFISYEGDQMMDLHRIAWHKGMNIPEKYPQRCKILTRRGPLLWSDGKKTLTDVRQLEELDAALVEMTTNNPGLPIVVVIDQATSALEDPINPTQASELMKSLRILADRGICVLLLAHPPKSGHSVYGSHVIVSLADIVGTLTRHNPSSRGWRSEIDFSIKHRPAPNEHSIFFKSKRLGEPIIDLPAGWDLDNPKARARALEDLKMSFINEMIVKPESYRDVFKAGVEQKEAKLIPTSSDGKVINAEGFFAVVKPKED